MALPYKTTGRTGLNVPLPVTNGAKDCPKSIYNIQNNIPQAWQLS